jgi:hypothetical protein
VVADDIYQCLNISISLYFRVVTLKKYNNMKVATESLYRPDAKAVLPEFVEYLYDFMASLTGLRSVRENPVVDLRHAGKVKYGLLK